MRRLLAFLLPAAAASCAAPDESPAVRTVIERYYERLSARDRAALPASFWPEATLSTVWQPPGINAITLLRHEGEWRIVSVGYSNDGEGAATGASRCT